MNPAGTNTSHEAPPSASTLATGPVLITRRLAFCASHRYENASWSQEKNREVFGSCFNPYGHGHNYELEVTLRGPVDPETGMVLNLRTVSDILQREVFKRFDHRYINKEVPGFEFTVPTLENLCLYIWDLLEREFAGFDCSLHRIRLFETADLYCEYHGEREDAEEDER